LPLQNNGQMNVQNPNSTDTLTINGVNNYAVVSNSTGTNNWGTRLIQGNALNYVPPVFVAEPAPAVFVPVAPTRVPSPPPFVAPFTPPLVPRPSLNLTSPAFSAGAFQQALQTYVNTPAPEVFRAEAPQPVSTLVGNVTVEQAAVAEPGRADDAVSPSRSGAVRVEQAENRLGAGVALMLHLSLSRHQALFLSVLLVLFLSLASPWWLKLQGVPPSWAVLWLLPWAVVEGPPEDVAELLRHVAEGTARAGSRVAGGVVRLVAHVEAKPKIGIEHMFTDVYDVMPPRLVAQQAEVKEHLRLHPLSAV
jgi:hypothetical protein